MTIFTSAYKREIDDSDGWTNPVEVELHRAYDGEPIRIQVGGTFGGTAHLDLPHARELREALDEAIMLATAAQWTEYRCTGCGAAYSALPYTVSPHRCAPPVPVTADSPAVLDAEGERLAREERWS